MKDILTALRRMDTPGPTCVVFDDGTPVARAAADQMERMQHALKAASSALRSYQHGNTATDLAKEVADFCDGALIGEHVIVQNIDTLANSPVNSQNR